MRYHTSETHQGRYCYKNKCPHGRDVVLKQLSVPGLVPPCIVEASGSALGLNSRKFCQASYLQFLNAVLWLKHPPRFVFARKFVKFAGFVIRFLKVRRKMKILHILFFILFLSLSTVSGCGGGSDGSDDISRTITDEFEDPDVEPEPGPQPRTITGQFKDANVRGLTYLSGGQEGVTDSNGMFACEDGRTVTFSVGGVEIGKSECKSVVTPVDLVSDGGSDSVQVNNIVRFLLVLDEDEDSSNGINISEAIRQTARDWEVDFGASDFSAALSPVIAAVEKVYGDSRTVASDVEAKSHLEETFRCAYSGVYGGTYVGGGKYSGDDGGFIGIMADASDGRVLGVGYFEDEEGDDAFVISSRSPEPITYDQEVAFAGEKVENRRFRGEFISVDNVKGTWVSMDDDGIEAETTSGQGTFSGSRVGGSKEALYRYTGIFKDEEYDNSDGTLGGEVSDWEGILFSLDIDESNTVTGYVYKVHQNRRYELSGAVSGNQMTFTAAEIGATGSGTVDLDAGTFSDTRWRDGSEIETTDSEITGSIIGSGCRLN